MRIPDLTYRPKENPIVYMEVCRRADQIPASIHMHDHHEIVLVTSEALCNITNNGSTVPVHAPAIWINRAGTFHEVIHVTEGSYESRVIFFHPELLSRLPGDMRYEKQLFRSDLTVLPISREQVQAFLPLFDLLKERSVPQKRLFLLSILCQMAQFIEEGNCTIRTAAAQSYIFDVIMCIRSAEDKQTIPALAERFHVSQTKLKNDFKRITGMSIGAFSTQLHLQQAAVLLETTGLSLAEIAYACGFCDESYFIESFRKRYAQTPGTYRRSKCTCKN